MYGNIIRIEQSLKGRSTGLHPLGRLHLGELLLFHELTEPKSNQQHKRKINTLKREL